MFAFLFRTTESTIEADFDIEAARQTMMGRMEVMLEGQTRRNTRFSVIENPRRQIV